MQVRVRADELAEDSVRAMVALFQANQGGAQASVVIEESGVYEATVRLGDDVRVAATPRLVEGLRSLFGRTDAVRLA